MPEAYLLLRQLRLYGSGGSLALPFQGGYLDQPAWLMDMLEACMNAEVRYSVQQALLKQKREAKSDDLQS